MKNIKYIKRFMMTAIGCIMFQAIGLSSSHREAPLISNDPLADNVDLYAFRSPEDPSTITIIATYVPLQLPQGGPNYYSFGENVRYEIHVDNDASVPGDEVTYRFTFNQENEDPTTFFNIRLGAQNLKTTYTLERSLDGGNTFETIITNGIVPPNNIGPRSIESGVGLGTTYDALFASGVTTANSGETVFAGPTDDPFFVDLAGIFDLGDAQRQSGTAVDGLACYNVSAIAMQIPISTLLKSGAPAQPTSILDSDYVIGVWASASRPSITTLSDSSDPAYSGDWIQVSRLGMPLTNEAVIPIGQKDFWNAITPYDEITETTMDEYFYNPELALYMDDDLFGGAVPAFAGLRIQKASLGAFDFTNGADGLFGLKGNPALEGTALDDAVFGTLLLPDAGKPRSVDLWPAFHTGVPNVIPYQLATGKAGNPLAAGKPFVNNFLPNGGDMLRLNMAVPPTPRNDVNFSSLGLIQAAAIGLTVAPFNTTADLEFIPNMDGFPNGRRLEDDVTRIELQAVAGVVLAAVGLWYDDYDPATSTSPVTQDLLNVLTYTTGVEANDRSFTATFPYLAQPSDGTGVCSGEVIDDGGDPPVSDVPPRFFVSSNTQQNIAYFDIANGQLNASTFRNVTRDADGIYYDSDNDVLYQLNRFNGAINIYNDVDRNLMAGNNPTFLRSTNSGTINGREITVSGNRLVAAQDASADNGDQNRLVVYDMATDGTSGLTDRIYDVDINLWGIQAIGEDLLAIIDNSNQLAVFQNFFANRSGNITPNRVVDIEGIIRTHGINYIPSLDLMLLTDVGSGANAEDGAIVIVNDYSQAVADGNISASEQVRIEGSSTSLGNPVDIGYDLLNNVIYVAERANGGGKVLGFDMTSMGGNILPSYSFDFAGASAIHIPNDEDGDLGPTLTTMAQLFASSNTQRTIGVYNILEANSIAEESFLGFANDADGIYYDETLDELYQLNRFNNSVNRYREVNTSLNQGLVPQFAMSSMANSKNGREIAWSNNRVVVAQDASAANNDQNAFLIYDVSQARITFSRKYNTDINLWGIHAEGEKLYAIIDNSNMLAEFDDFFDHQGPNISPDRTISVDGLIRTHGISYDAMNDIMYLTDVGAASDPTDGAFIVVRNYISASSDGNISMSEQTRIAGPSSMLGNPVDIAFDRDREMVFIAERANNGGMILGFMVTQTSGDLAPSYMDLFDGASAVYLTGGMARRSFYREEVVSMNMDVVVDTYDFLAEVNKDKIVVNDLALSSDDNDGVLKVNVFPNPTTDILNVSVRGNMNMYENATLEIYDNTGKVLHTEQSPASKTNIDVSGFTPGLYYLRLSSNEYLDVLKFNKI